MFKRRSLWLCSICGEIKALSGNLAAYIFQSAMALARRSVAVAPPTAPMSQPG